MKYPFSPQLLDALPEELAELFRGLEDTLLGEICSRLKAADQLNELTIQDIRALREHGIDLKDIKKAIKDTAGIAEKRLDELLDDVIARNQQYYDDLITLADVTKPDVLVDQSTIAAIKKQAQREIGNLPRSMGFLVDAGRTMLEPAKAYQWALDSAVLEIQSGAINYNQAISEAVKQLAESGIKTVDYESGHVDQIDVAARRAVMTGVSQLCAKYTEQSAEWLETPYFEVSAHAGARDKPGASPWASHKDWQGKVYSVRSGDIYPNIYTVCGLGYVDGLEGANCRHRRYPWVEGVSERSYTDDELAHIDDGLGCAYDGKAYTAYEATQMQRRLERTIRKQKRLKEAYKAAGLKEDAQTANIKLRRLNAKYKEFSKAAGLPEQRERMKVTYTDDKSAAAAEASYAKSANDTSVATPGMPEMVGKVDFNDKQAIINRLEEAESELQGLDYEVNYSITSDGKVWRVLGESSTVDLSNIPSSLAGSYSYHNHPPKQTYYSFSASDAAFFINSGEAYSKASDHVYEYVMRRMDGTIEKSYEKVYHRFKEIYASDVMKMEWDGLIDPDVDEYHEIMKILSKELRFEYVRKKKNR